jgi:class 3 adenylate cyclase
MQFLVATSCVYDIVPYVHRELRQLLRTATGDSRFVVVVFLDIRGFSSFAKIAESSESAVFLKSAYSAIIDEYFDQASFFKPTGDGLLVVLDYEEDTLGEVVNDALSTSIKLVEAFPSICSDDPMVNFDVPVDLGVGLARGAATRLHSGDKVLDYSGRPLNLASRLMNIARPSGVVFSDALGLELLDDSLLSQFEADEVYVKGLAEDEPMSVHYLTSRTIIDDIFKRPIRRSHVHAETAMERSVRELTQMANFRIPLTKEPIDRSKIFLTASFPDATPSGKRSKNLWTYTEIPATYGEDADGPFVHAYMPELASRLTAKGAKSTWKGRLRLEYLVSDE